MSLRWGCRRGRGLKAHSSTPLPLLNTWVHRGGRIIQAAGTNLDVPQQPRLVAVLELPTTSTLPPGRCKKGCPGVLPDASEPCTLVGSLLEVSELGGSPPSLGNPPMAVPHICTPLL